MRTKLERRPTKPIRWEPCSICPECTTKIDKPAKVVVTHGPAKFPMHFCPHCNQSILASGADYYPSAHPMALADVATDPVAYPPALQRRKMLNWQDQDRIKTIRHLPLWEHVDDAGKVRKVEYADGTVEDHEESGDLFAGKFSETGELQERAARGKGSA